MDMLEQTSRSTTPETGTGTQPTANAPSKIIIQADPRIEAKTQLVARSVRFCFGLVSSVSR